MKIVGEESARLSFKKRTLPLAAMGGGLRGRRLNFESRRGQKKIPSTGKWGGEFGPLFFSHQSSNKEGDLNGDKSTNRGEMHEFEIILPIHVR